MADQLSSGTIGTIAISIPIEENKAIARDTQLTLALQRLKEDEVQNQ